jgi:hypothetical protein
MDIKPIETNYKGYRFRSRLEARWAVFFDTWGVKWEYEPEGFSLPHGKYLPDFWLPEWNAWFEVKPEGGITERAALLAKELCESTRYGVLISDGLPKTEYQGQAFFWSQISLGDECDPKYNPIVRLFNAENRVIETENEVGKQASLSHLRKEVKVSYIESEYWLHSFNVRKFSFVFTNYPDGDGDIWCVLKDFDAYEILRAIQQNDDLHIYDHEEPEWHVHGSDIVSPYVYYYRIHRDGFVTYKHRSPFVHDDTDTEYIKDSIGEGEWTDGNFGKVEDAIKAAKSARFEHGETGVVAKPPTAPENSTPATWRVVEKMERTVAPPIPFTRIDQKEWPKDLQKLLARLERHWLCFTWPDMAIDHNLRSYGDIDGCLEDIIQGMGWLDDANYTTWPCENRDCFWSGIRELSVRMVAIFGAEAAKKVGIPEDEWRPLHWEIRNGVIIAELWSFEDMMAQRSRIEDCTTFLKTTIRQLRL